MLVLSLRSRQWLVLQVVFIAVCYRGNVLCERAQGCVGSQLSLRCPEMKVIQITAVVLGRSNCRRKSCCITDNDCTSNANENHRTDVHRRCDNKQSCTVRVLKEKIPCGSSGAWYNNDFERITYICIDDPQIRVQSCVESQLSLRCPEMKVIKITSVVLGDSYCRGAKCCIRDSDCTRNANENHRTDVQRRCDNKQSCAVGVLKGKINCGFFNLLAYNDFERIIYICIDDPQRSTTATFSRPDSTGNILRTEENTPEKETENESSTKDSYLFLDGITTTTDIQSKEGDSIRHDENRAAEDREYNSLMLPVVMTTVCLLVLIAIVVVVVMMRRKRWPKVSAAAEMVDNDSSDRSEGMLYANENQTMNLNDGSGSPIYSNHKIKKSRDKGAKATETHEVPNNVVYSLVDGDGSRPTVDPIVHCDVESREPAYQVPRLISDVYSFARDVGEPECAGSTADASNEYDNVHWVHCEVATREPAKVANNSAQNAYDEAINWMESEYKAMNADKTIPPAQKKKTDNPVHKIAPDLYTKVNKPSKNAAAFDSSGNVEAKDKDNIGDAFPNPIYETMSHVIPESIYANAPALSPSLSLASRALPTAGSETENPTVRCGRLL